MVSAIVSKGFKVFSGSSEKNRIIPGPSSSSSASSTPNLQSNTHAPNTLANSLATSLAINSNGTGENGVLPVKVNVPVPVQSNGNGSANNINNNENNNNNNKTNTVKDSQQHSSNGGKPNTVAPSSTTAILQQQQQPPPQPQTDPTPHPLPHLQQIQNQSQNNNSLSMDLESITDSDAIPLTDNNLNDDSEMLASEMRSRDESCTTVILDTGMTDFIINHVYDDAPIENYTPSFRRKADAATRAMTAALQYFMFESDSADVRSLFIQELEKRSIKAGDFVCKEGDSGEEMYVLEQGSIDVIVGVIKVGTMNVGAVFGELSLIYGTKRTASCIAKSDCIVYCLSKIPFRRIQATIAMSSIEVSMESFHKEMSSLSEFQEKATWMSAEIVFDECTTHSVLGQGTFGQVTLVTVNSRPNESFAMKRMSKQSIVASDHQQRVILEKNALQKMTCPFIINLLGTYQDASSVYFLTDVVMGGDLMTYMIDQDILNVTESQFLLANLCEAIAHTHEKGFIHRDIKPENCLIGADGYLKLCDYGLAKRLPAQVVLPKSGTTEVVTLAFTMCGTPEFMAPEFVLSTGYTKTADWWAVGAILYEMHCGRNPFDKGGDLKKTFKAVCMIGMGREIMKIPSAMEERDPLASAFVKALLCPEAKRLGRGRTRDVCDHPYFHNLSRELMCSKELSAPYVPTVEGFMDASNFNQKNLEVERYEDYSGDGDWCKDF